MFNSFQINLQTLCHYRWRITLVWQGHDNKIPGAERFTHEKWTSSRFWRLEAQSQGVGVWFLLRPLSSACTLVSLWCLHTSSSRKDTSPRDYSPPWQPHSISITSLHAPSPNQPRWELLGFQICGGQDSAPKGTAAGMPEQLLTPLPASFTAPVLGHRAGLCPNRRWVGVVAPPQARPSQVPDHPHLPWRWGPFVQAGASPTKGTWLSEKPPAGQPATPHLLQAVTEAGQASTAIRSSHAAANMHRLMENMHTQHHVFPVRDPPPRTCRPFMVLSYLLSRALRCCTEGGAGV